MVAGVLVVVGGAGQAFSDQVNNAIVVQRLAKAVRDTRALTGAYPPSLDERDFFGRPIHYVVREDGFVLVSFGRGGTADRPDDSDLIGAELEPESTCLRPWADTVATDRRLVAFCLK
jgi:hypothetical protein